MNKKKSGGLLGGFIFLIIGIGLLWYNEGRTVRMQEAIKEATKAYKDVSSTEIKSENDGALVATTGKITLPEASTLKDSKFGISVSAAKLKRVVEMYQWKEECEEDSDGNETCTYSKEWSDSIIDSSNFSQAGHTNPTSFIVEEDEYFAEGVKVGEYVLSERMMEKLSYDKKIGAEVINEQYNNPVEGFVVNDKYITNSSNPSNPQIGDLRISYEYAGVGEVSMMGVQDENTLKAFTSKKGESILIVKRGTYTGKELLVQMTKENNMLKWILRLVGVLLVIFGVAALFSPLQMLTNKIPILNNVVGFSVGLISFVAGLAISLVVIAIAWFRFRPLLSIILIAIVIALVIFLKTRKPNNEKE